MMTTNIYSEPLNNKKRFRNPFSGVKSRVNGLPKRKSLMFVALVILILAIVYFVKGNAFKSGSNNSSVLGSSGNDRVQLPDAKASQTLNKEFSFPLKDEKGKEISQLKYTIEAAELRDQIIVKGQKATSVEGRTFLILNLKLVNEYTKPIDIKTGDYLRLSVNGNEGEWLAPDMNNDPVSVQAISTKYTRVGFPINDTDKNLQLRVGEIEGEKQIVPLDLN
jgi:hypothetical protein